MLIKIESIRCPDVTGLVSGCLRNCRPDTPEYAKRYIETAKEYEERVILYLYWNKNNQKIYKEA